LLEATEGFRVDDPVAVSLEGGPDTAFVLYNPSSPTLGVQLGKGRQKLFFSLFKHFPDRHPSFLYPRHRPGAGEKVVIYKTLRFKLISSYESNAVPLPFERAFSLFYPWLGRLYVYPAYRKNFTAYRAFRQ